MSIVSLESADEKNVSASILNFLTAYGVISLLSKCGGTKLCLNITVVGSIAVCSPEPPVRNYNMLARAIRAQ